TPWPKLARTKAAFAAVLGRATQPDLPALYAALADRTPAEDASLPDTGIGLARERLLSSPFIVSPDYGTRGSTVLALHADGRGDLHERRVGPAGMPARHSEPALTSRARSLRLRTSPARTNLKAMSRTTGPARPGRGQAPGFPGERP